MIQHKITKNLKPTEIDVSFKYICPNTNCNNEHWLFLRQVKTKNFKVVCECNTVFKPKHIKNIKVIYYKNKSTKNKIDNVVNSDKTHNTDPVVVRAIGIMRSLGYSDKESELCINAAYDSATYSDPKILVKTAISNFGVNND